MVGGRGFGGVGDGGVAVEGASNPRSLARGPISHLFLVSTSTAKNKKKTKMKNNLPAVMSRAEPPCPVILLSPCRRIMVPTGNMMPIAIDAQDCMSDPVYEEKAGSGPVWPWLLVLDLRCDKKWHHGSGEKGDILRERERKRAAWEDGDGSRRQVSWLMGYLSGQVPPSFLDKLGLSENFVDCCLRRSTSHQGRQPGWISTSKSQPISWQHCFSASMSTSGKFERQRTKNLACPACTLRVSSVL